MLDKKCFFLWSIKVWITYYILLNHRLISSLKNFIPQQKSFIKCQNFADRDLSDELHHKNGATSIKMPIKTLFLNPCLYPCGFNPVILNNFKKLKKRTDHWTLPKTSAPSQSIFNSSTYRISDLLQNPPIQQIITVAGWCQTSRKISNAPQIPLFIEVNDGSSIQNLQVVVEKTFHPNCTHWPPHRGQSILITGSLVNSPGWKQGIELRVTEPKDGHQITSFSDYQLQNALSEQVKEILESDGDNVQNDHAADAKTKIYPLAKKTHSLPFLRSIPHLRSRSRLFGAVTRIRSEVIQCIHQFFHKNRFTLITTPILTENSCEGGSDVFYVHSKSHCHLNKNISKSSNISTFKHNNAFLSVSGQLALECMCCCLGNVYSLGPVFRAERSDTPRHLSEFWMAEAEVAFCNLSKLIELAGKFVKYVISSILKTCAADLSFLEKFQNTSFQSQLDAMVYSEFPIITYDEAIKTIQKYNLKNNTQRKCVWGNGLSSADEAIIVSEARSPVFITNIPIQLSPFYTRVAKDVEKTESMELLFPEIGELIGGSMREERFEILKRNMELKNISSKTLEWYLDSRRFNSTIPHGGMGLGVERLLMLLTKMKNIQDVTSFPRTFEKKDLIG